MTLVLIAAMAVSFGTQDFISGGVIAALVVINVGVGTINEYQAEKTVAALEAIGAPTANVLRRKAAGSPGEIQTIKTDLVVPGDILLIKIGDIVPMDGRWVFKSLLVSLIELQLKRPFSQNRYWRARWLGMRRGITHR
jgi:Na+-exporting ATPase